MTLGEAGRDPAHFLDCNRGILVGSGFMDDAVLDGVDDDKPVTAGEVRTLGVLDRPKGL